MRAVDTNIVIGLLTGMSCTDRRAIAAALEEAAAGDPLIVTEGVLVETECVLRRRFGMARRDSAAALSEMLDTSALGAWDPQLVSTALRVMAAEPRLDVVDSLLVARDLLGEATVVSLDRLLVRTLSDQHRRSGG